MKVELLTLHNIKNYGSVLQTIASEAVLSEFFEQVETYRYIRKDTANEVLIDTWLEDVHGIKRKLKEIPCKFLLKKFIHVFDTYLEQHVNLTKQTYQTESDFSKFPVKADVYCVGSDQVWNSGWNKGFISDFFLTFLDNNSYKFSLCSSFGKEALEEWEIEPTKKCLQSFRAISVRESSAKKIINDINLDCIHLLDPTLLVKKGFWKSYTAKRIIKEDYVLVYQLNTNPAFDAYAKELAKRKGLKLVIIAVRTRQLFQSGKILFVPKVDEFLSLIRYASYIVTDSFHGTAFSINFNKNFVSIYPEHFSTRLESILQWAGIENRHLKDYRNFAIADYEINWEEINEKLHQERSKARTYLKGIREEIKSE